MDDIVQLNLNDFDAAIFDMDGTMINNMEYHKKAWREFVKRHGMSFTDEEFREKFSGKKNDEIFSGIFGLDLTPEQINQYAEEKESIYRELYAADIEPVSGLHQLIETLQRAEKKVAVATSAPKDNRDFGFKALQLENIFSVVVGEEDLTQGKPHPEAFLKAAAQLGLSPDRCLVFEDSPSGVTAGKSAGMTVIGLLTTHPQEDLKEADYCIKDFTFIHFI